MKKVEIKKMLEPKNNIGLKWASNLSSIHSAVEIVV